MKKAAINVSRPRLYFPALLAASFLAFIALAQEGKRPVTTEGKRPVTVNEGKVTEAPRSIRAVSNVANLLPRRAEYSWVVVQTDVENTEVKINGQPVSKSSDGDFRKELPANKRYTVSVSASNDFLPYTDTFLLSAKQPKIIADPLKSKFASIKIVTAQEALQGAKVTIDGKEQPLKYDKANSAILIERVEPGDHTISFDHPDYVLAERHMNLAANIESTWSFVPERPFVELDVQTDPETVVYVDNEPKGDVTSEGSFKRTDIKIGAHEIRLVKDGYEEYKQVHNFEFRKPVKIDYRLVPKVSKDFNELFDLPDASRWTFPASGFKIEAGWMKVAGARQLGYPTNFFYRDFTMQFQLKLLSDAGAAWAVRAKDSENYYLFYLSGPGGAIPNKFLTYIVRNNSFDPMKPADVAIPLVISAKKGDTYTVIIEANGNVINHIVKPSSMNEEDKRRGLAGEDVNLGSYTDQKRTFTYGGVGFRTVGAEIFAIDELYVKGR